MARISDEEIARRVEIEYERVKMTDEQALERWGHLPEAERERRRNLSDTAKARTQVIVDDETGERLLGGRHPGHDLRPKKRFAQRVAELAQGDWGDELENALRSGLSPDNNAAVRVNTAMKIIQVEREERELEMKEDEFSNRTKDDLVEYLAAQFAKATREGKMPDLRVLAEIDDGTVVEGSATEA